MDTEFRLSPFTFLEVTPYADLNKFKDIDKSKGLHGGVNFEFRIMETLKLYIRPEYREMYWSPAQMVAHMTVNGATLRSGDIFGSGTISGPAKETRGCFLELTWSGQEPVTLADASTRTFLEDGDTITLRASAPGPNGTVIGLAECVGTIAPAP